MRRTRTWLSLLAAILLAGCTTPPATPTPSPSPTATSHSPTAVLMTSDTPDGFTLDLAPGWQTHTRRTDRLVAYQAPEGEPINYTRARLQIIRYPRDRALSHLQQNGSFGYWVEPSHAYDHFCPDPVVRLTRLPERTIGGEPAHGCGGRLENRWDTEMYEQWIVVRHDGLWAFQLMAADGDTELPPPLHQMLDTFRWTTPAPSPTASQS
ncbi:hypothetical protein [Arachnia propionica]|uniref:Lipoprotein n=1 Tax=Arachnia propionica TaxID=1750 RepID=A0A3P1WM32_9ACTN|nr:hypothetical protein [Arachnia propionica]RRD47604.1 hypothetical protein EII35_14895 [Arachnia propionica]